METALATGAARFLVQKVADVLQLDQKLKDLSDIEGKMEKLKELSTIIDKVIQDVEASSVGDDAAAVKKLLRKLKYLAYDLEDVVDYYDTEALRKQRSRAYSRPVRDFFSSDNNQLIFKRRISGMIRAVTKNLDSILLQKSILENFPQGTNRIAQSAYREIHSHNSLAVIGREKEKEKIVEMLTDDEGSSNGTVKVIAIVGMGGLGKTTLARHVFNDERVEAYFEKFTIWKVVGAIFDPTEIMKSVLQLATRAQVKISEPELVREELEKALSGKRFLLVLDDVWNEDALQWRALEAALACGARGSKVLVTTRSREVSSIMSSFNTHQIQQLSRNDCLSLFQQFAFGDEEANENLIEIGRKIVKKCGGVPLAAISLGSMLHSTRDETYWSSVLNSEVWQLRDVDQKFLAVLKLSYDALPLRSKKCFAFGSLFPKNSVMNKDELIRLWTANGFVCKEENFDAETVGNRIFDDLVLRSFFLLAPRQYHDYGGHPKIKCTMHDLMHDMARSVSEGEYYSLEYSQLNNDIQKRTYHLRLFYAILPNDYQAYFQRLSYLRTLILIGCGLHQNTNLLQLIFSELKFLRVLDLSRNYIRNVPTSIGNLIHLRYLDLSWNDIKVLPDTITALQNLQYLSLHANNSLLELPKNLGNLQSLRYLDCSHHRLTHMPLGLSRLTSLRSLPCFVVGNRIDSCSITELEDLKLRGQMTITFLKKPWHYSCGGRKILKNKDFNELSLSFGSVTSDMSMMDDLCPNTGLKKLMIFNYGSRQFSTWLTDSQLPNLIEVTLENCYPCEHVPQFGNLQFLKKLVIEYMPGVKHMGAEFHGHGTIRGFPSLQELQLRRMPYLEEWSESDGADGLFPLLKRLEIYSCPILKTMPRLPSIESLNLSHCSNSLLSCVAIMNSLSHLSLRSIEGMTSLPSVCLRNLTSLTTLEIKSCEELQFLPRDEMQSLHSLSIEECKILTSFPSEVGLLGALRRLGLSRCGSLMLRPEILVQILNSLHKFDIQICHKYVNLCGQLQHFHTLRQLSITGSHNAFSAIGKAFNSASLVICCCDELESLMAGEPSTSVLESLHVEEFPEWLHDLRSLRHLRIRNCPREPSTSVLESLYVEEFPNLTTLPEWLQYLRSLRHLRIRNCPRLRSLPRCLKNLRLLNNLYIKECSPQLESRCKRETGEDWPIISHVSCISIFPKVTNNIHRAQIRRPFHIPYKVSDPWLNIDGEVQSIEAKRRYQLHRSIDLFDEYDFRSIDLLDENDFQYIDLFDEYDF